MPFVKIKAVKQFHSPIHGNVLSGDVLPCSEAIAAHYLDNGLCEQLGAPDTPANSAPRAKTAPKKAAAKKAAPTTAAK